MNKNDHTAAWLRFIDALGLEERTAWLLALERLRHLSQASRAGPRAAP